MRDTFYNMLVLLAIAVFAALVTFSLIRLGDYTHPANDCQEDEVWAPVEYGTPGSQEDRAGVNRVCINLEEL